MYDAAVIGLGGMGSATAAWSARRGLRTVGFDRYEPIHAFGSSHGKVRLIRMAYFEGPDYVPLLRHAYTLWRDLERWSGARLFDERGALYTGTRSTGLISGTLASAEQFGIDVRAYEPDELRKRFPYLKPGDDEIGVYEKAAGVVFPEVTVAACIQTARDAGADLRFETGVARWEPVAGGVRVHLESGETVDAKRLAICAGAWLSETLGGLNAPVRIERNVQAWFDPADRRGLPHDIPAFALERDGRFFYGFPDYGEGVKCAFHHSGTFAESPGHLEREVTGNDVAQLHEWLSGFAPRLAGLMENATACMYDLTPDGHFIIGPHPGVDNVYIAGGFSGHGFKFVPAIGDIMAGYLENGATAHPVETFSPQRFA